MIIHPRPSPIAAAMYQLRDIGVDAIIIHGPSGCCFRTARLLELDGVRVFTSNIDENAIVFGASENLKKVLDYAVEYLKNKLNKEKPLIGIVGTCVSMIIGENLEEFVNYEKATVIPVEVHSGFGDNTVGAIKAMESALKLGIIDEDEFKRQKYLLKKATEIEKSRGMAKREYIKPTYEDDTEDVINLLKSMKNKDTKIACVLNAKKETAYLFVHPLIVLNKYFNCVNIANLDENKGLKKIRNDAKNILKRFRPDYITGGLDEYPISGEKVVEILNSLDDIDLIVVSGVPHALPIENLKKDIIKIAISDGPRTYYPIKELYDYAIVEFDAHAKVLGKRDIVKSRFGEILEHELR
ncbi:Ni-sirohydrochlorin a,c-diamide reductive cyclase catalytic subunit [Methanocaldococcus sp.]|uniref:Ni-sirohydrochlorin a,c-diamide reductive cyclase catalytic subunit n=1 Tax=Methanocaldococcus sp. TaxID=2152917 RepID=UPI002637EFF2|nr:Ni-sirohydrochlorin a,c-diamide reductive cyclase catalytic subunit [Methanocaldococcus sp.]MCQ6254119.1 Ni-sirohydrochlorin a,c-diamide reductive cyclase catalytic subunit [Methanocaldococcus sp.]